MWSASARGPPRPSRGSGPCRLTRKGCLRQECARRGWRCRPGWRWPRARTLRTTPRKMLAAAGKRNAARGGARSREAAAAGVTLGECAATSPPPAMPSATVLRTRERRRAREGDARGRRYFIYRAPLGYWEPLDWNSAATIRYVEVKQQRCWAKPEAQLV
jgi:hypothetical protein